MKPKESIFLVWWCKTFCPISHDLIRSLRNNSKPNCFRVLR